MLRIIPSGKNRETKLYIPQDYQNIFTEAKNSRQNTAKCLQQLCGAVKLGITSLLPFCGLFLCYYFRKKNIILKYACVCACVRTVYAGRRHRSPERGGLPAHSIHCSRSLLFGVSRALSYTPSSEVGAPFSFSPRNPPS